MSLSAFSRNLFLAFLLGSVAACSTSPEKGLKIEGKIEGADGMTVYLDQLNGPGQAALGLENTTADNAGNFSLQLPESVAAGQYRLRVGAAKVPLVLDENTRLVEVDGSLNGILQYDYALAGSGASAGLQQILRGLAVKTSDADDLTTYIDTVKNPYAAGTVAELALGKNGKYLPLHKKVSERLAAEYPGTPYTKTYRTYTDQIEANYLAQQAQQRVRIGEIAPNIKLKDPQGREYELKYLRGQVVLLDFWASWCGPCRRENPNVVRVYDKYKRDGFTVFSVSLDGLDSRTKARFASQEEIDAQLKRQRDKWISAIEKDNLKWPYHVSDLKKWESFAAKTYGISSIPRTFLLDRDGRIVAINPRGQQLEPALKKALGS